MPCAASHSLWAVTFFQKGATGLGEPETLGAHPLGLVEAGGSRDLTISLRVLAGPRQGQGTMGVVRGHVGMEVAENLTCPSSKTWSRSSVSEPLSHLGLVTRSGPSELTSPW